MLEQNARGQRHERVDVAVAHGQYQPGRPAQVGADEAPPGKILVTFASSAGSAQSRSTGIPPCAPDGKCVIGRANNAAKSP
jgi:hypothetical protein